MHKLYISILIVFLFSSVGFAGGYFQVKKDREGHIIRIWITRNGKDYEIKVPKYIENPNRNSYKPKLYLNEDLIQKRALFVYGVPEDVPNNEVRHGHYRYLGYDVNGSLFSNEWFPNDVNTGLEPWQKQWVLKPWGENPSETPLYNLHKDAAFWLDLLSWSKTYEPRSKWDGETLVNYLSIQSPPGDFTPGSARGWHVYNGTLLYQTFTIPPPVFDFEAVKANYKQEESVEIQEGSLVILKAVVMCYNIHGPAKGKTKSAWFYNGYRDPNYTNDDFVVDKERETEYSLIMPDHDVTITFKVNYMEDSPGYEFIEKFSDNTVTWKLKCIRKSSNNGISTSLEQGKIKFEPNSTDWTNKDLLVKVYIDGNKKVRQTGRASRMYKWSHSVYNEKTKNWELCYHTETVQCDYYQDWIPEGVIVNGSLLNPSSKQIADAEKVILTNEGKGVLNAKLVGWKPLTQESVWIHKPCPGDCWVSGNPPVTSAPSDLYASCSGEYKIDKTQPKISVNWSVQEDGFKDGFHEFYFESDNSIEVTVLDNLSGIAQVKYLWSPNEIHPDIIQMKSLGVTTAEGKMDSMAVKIKVHENNKWKIGKWYLYIYLKDRAGNEKWEVLRINIKSILYNFRIVDIKDPSWKDVFRDDKNNLKVANFKVANLPAENNLQNKGTIPKKGYAFYFKFNSKGLNQDMDKIIITPKFYYLSNLTRFTRQEVDLYYHLNNQYFIKVGGAKDLVEINYNEKSIGGMSKLELDKEQRIEFDTKTGEWSGRYFIIYSAVPVKKDSNPLIEANRYREGYILVNFQLEAYKDNELVFTYVPNKWIEEGGPRPGFSPGDVIIYDNRYSALYDYDIRTDR